MNSPCLILCIASPRWSPTPGMRWCLHPVSYLRQRCTTAEGLRTERESVWNFAFCLLSEHGCSSRYKKQKRENKRASCHVMFFRSHSNSGDLQATVSKLGGEAPPNNPRATILRNVSC